MFKALRHLEDRLRSLRAKACTSSHPFIKVGEAALLNISRWYYEKERMSNIWSRWPRWKQAMGGHWFLNVRDNIDLIKFIPSFLHSSAAHQCVRWHNRHSTVRDCSLRVPLRFKLGRNTLCCSATVDEERLFFLWDTFYSYVHLFFLCLWEMGGVVRQVVGLFSCSYLLGLFFFFFP